jgi:hypothetical protein
MTAVRLAAIVLILVVATAGWFVLGGSVAYRTETAADRGQDAVSGLWGQEQVQRAPSFTAPGASVELAGSDITADFELQQRRKGLLWFSTYVVDFTADYRLRNPGDQDTAARMSLAFPAPDGVYDGFAVESEGRRLPVTYENGSAIAQIPIPAGETVVVSTGYRTNGLDEWRYEPSPDGIGVIDDFTLTMITDFPDVDFPGDGVSPTEKRQTAEGWELAWEYDSLVSGRPIALVMPTPLNPGPIAQRISFFAPVSLLFYFASLVLLTSTEDVRLHPMHYAFLAAGFFAFHLLFAYLADRIDINLAFGIGALVSLALCIAYLGVVVGRSRALVEVAVGQILFLVLFSYSFFFEGLTGIAVTIGSVATLAFFMAKTARVDWERVFRRPESGHAWPHQAAQTPRV